MIAASEFFTTPSYNTCLVCFSTNAGVLLGMRTLFRLYERKNTNTSVEGLWVFLSFGFFIRTPSSFAYIRFFSRISIFRMQKEIKRNKKNNSLMNINTHISRANNVRSLCLPLFSNYLRACKFAAVLINFLIYWEANNRRLHWLVWIISLLIFIFFPSLVASHTSRVVCACVCVCGYFRVFAIGYSVSLWLRLLSHSFHFFAIFFSVCLAAFHSHSDVMFGWMLIANSLH